MSSAITAYPLCWPHGRPRTDSYRRSHARFETTFGAARDALSAEIDRLGGNNAVLSTNVQLNLSGAPYANRPEPSDPGVAVYFSLKRKVRGQAVEQQFAFACDRWLTVRDNIQAIRKTIEALRGIERWGTGDMVQAAFTGFAALPTPEQATAPTWRTILGFAEGVPVTAAALEEQYRRRRSEVHPDRVGGNADMFDLVQRAVEQARRELA